MLVWGRDAEPTEAVPLHLEIERAVLDLAFDENDGTTVVDFKTDHELSAGEARYRAQLQKYVDAVAMATGRPARGVLFKV